MIAAIVAVDNDWGIGYKGDLLEYIPNDLKHFKKLTTGNVVVMGKNTWDSLPNKPLPDRLNVVIDFVKGINYIDDAIYGNLKDVVGMMKFSNEKAIALNEESNWFIIGGGSIYKQLLPYCDRVYITKIYKNHENIDTYFPNLDKDTSWTSSPIGGPQEYNGISYQFWQYDRIN